MGMRIGICGVRNFGRSFVELFQRHPAVDEVVLADLDAELLAERAKEFGVSQTCASLDELCALDVDAIGIFTQRWRHAPQAVQALKAGKHVLSAVPAAITLEELHELVDTVKTTGLTYMLAETSYYAVPDLYCRKRFAAGDFGRFVYGEAQYHHDMYHFYRPYYGSNGEAWRSFASFPPMLYPTHTVAHVLSVTFSRMTHVSCLGFVDDHRDGIFDEKLSHWNNTFSNQTALFRTADGGMARVNEFRRTGARESKLSIVGTMGAYEEQPAPYSNEAVKEDVRVGVARCKMPVATSVFTQYREVEPNAADSFDYTKQYMSESYEDVSHIHLNQYGVRITEENLGSLPPEYIGKTHQGVSVVHPIERIPQELVGAPNSHSGAHIFLTLDFVEAVTTGKLPPNNVWLAARYNAPGIVAHESSRRGGEMMEIPDFGTPPEDAQYMDPLSVLH